MNLVTIKDKFQVTLPARLRKSLNVKVGDVLEVELSGSKIVLIPQAVLSRNKVVEPLRKLPSKLNKNDDKTLGMAEQVLRNLRSLLGR